MATLVHDTGEGLFYLSYVTATVWFSQVLVLCIAKIDICTYSTLKDGEISSARTALFLMCVCVCVFLPMKILGPLLSKFEIALERLK